jgi:hypothetical protein
MALYLGLVFDLFNGLKDGQDLFQTQNNGQPFWDLRIGDVLYHLWSLQGDPVKEFAVT